MCEMYCAAVAMCLSVVYTCTSVLSVVYVAMALECCICTSTHVEEDVVNVLLSVNFLW